MFTPQPLLFVGSRVLPTALTAQHVCFALRTVRRAMGMGGC